MQARYEDEALDLRRKRRRAMVTRVLDGAEYLPDDERQLLLAVYARGMRVSEVAAMLGEPERPLRRRVRALVRRVLDPAFPVVVARSGQWPRPVRRVAEMVVVEGLSVREVSQRTGESYHTVRQRLTSVRALVDSAPAGELGGVA